MGRTALVTGANGFIGSHLVEWLQERGDRPIAMVRKTSNTANLDASGAERRHGSLSNLDSLIAAMEGVDVVYHVAGITAAFTPDALREVNAAGTSRVFEAAGKAKNGPSRVVLVSSLEAAGPSHHDVARAEHHRPEPFTWYGTSKFGGEQAAWEAAQAATSFDVVIVRPPLVYGPRDQDVLQMIQSANWRIVARPGFRDTWMSAIHSHDLVRGIALAGDAGKPLPKEHEGHVLAGGGHDHDAVLDDAAHPVGQGIYFFDDGGRHSIKSFGHQAAAALGKKAMTLPVPGPIGWIGAVGAELAGRMSGRAPAFNRDKHRASVASGWWCDASRARHELGYAPEMPLEAGLEQTVRWLRDHKVL
jgi:nucleoside-diphosphate-sugar epimerase